MRFIHAADIHLGNLQYRHQERYADFFRAFDQVARTAIETQAQVCVIAGDLFDKSVVDPESLLYAERILSKMRRENIEVIAITGNHDRPRYNDPQSWLYYLHQNGYLTLLDRAKEGSQYLVDGATYVDVNGVRFIGVPWYGASTSLAIQQISGELPMMSWDGIRYTVLIMHIGLETEFPDVAGCMRMTDLLPVRPYVQYIATGHLHKPYIVDNWVHNPGSIENCAFDEETFRRLGKGVFVVDVAADGSARIEKRVIYGRVFHSIYFDVDKYFTSSELEHALTGRVCLEAEKWDVLDDLPVVRVVLRGTLGFDRMQFDLDGLRASLEGLINCLLLRVETQMEGFSFSSDMPEEITFDRLERQVFEDLARSDATYSERAESWGQFMRVMKDMALNATAPEEIYQQLRRQMWEA
jgi:DNA repair protein SbcD/Mre11